MNMCEVGTIFLLITLLITDKFSCDGMSTANTGSGALLQGDPAPGRSPGPPELSGEHHKTTDDHSTIVLTSTQSNENCSLEGHVQYKSGKNLSVQVNHFLFNTDILVFGVVYQVIISRVQFQEPAGEYIISSSIEGIPKGTFYSDRPSSHICQEHVHKGQFFEYSNVILNWTAEENRQFNKSNVTFTLKYKTDNQPIVHESIYEIPIIQDCQLWLKNKSEEVDSKNFPRRDCICWFPGPSSDHGLVIDITRLNVACFRGYLYFSGLNTSQHQHIRGHKQTRICGKLEELSLSDRHIYFPPSHTPPFVHLYGNPVFSLNYHLVDYCYNVTFTGRNGSFELSPKGELQCTFKIYMPYGHRIALKLRIGDSRSTGLPDSNTDLQSNRDTKCEGLSFELHDGNDIRSYCTKSGDAESQIEFVSRENKIVLKVLLKNSEGSRLGMEIKYTAEPIESLVGTCEFGWVAHRQYCLIAVEETKLPWMQAEMECARKGGHLASVRSSETQNIIDKILFNSPGYRDYNAYWIGASDKTHEGDFHWSNGQPFTYTNWFPGWSEYGNYNRQPNDDGLSEQDCVEIRRIYSLPSSSPSLAPAFMWNDRDCATPNYFICERPRNDDALEESWPPDCNKSVTLSNQQQRAVISSPGFPRQYPNNADCNTDITAPAGYRIALDFEELVLENESTCSYDFLEILENASNITYDNNAQSKRLCGDWSSKLKLLRYVSKGSTLKLRFSSDYSHRYGGFKVRASMENVSVMQCADDRFRIFNNTCYLFVNYPEVMWNTSEEICAGIKSQLVSVLTIDEENFITSNIREASEYRTTVSYWLGAKLDRSGKFTWTDGNEMIFTNWVPGEKPLENDIIFNTGDSFCLSLQWIPSTNPLIQSGHYWKPQKCSAIGGYVCKRPKQSLEPDINFNKTVNGSEGQLTSPNYPGNYYNNLDFTIKIIGAERTRIIIHFDKIDIEYQMECLYDYVEIKSINNQIDRYNDGVRHCGYHDSNMNQFDFVSQTNEAELRFHSDYSVTRGGIYLHWYSVDTTGCPEQTLTATEGIIQSPNYPHFLLANLDCTYTVLAPPNKRVWLEFIDFDLGSGNYFNQSEFKTEEAVVNVKLGYNSLLIYPYSNPDVLTEGAFLSYSEKLILKVRTKMQPLGRGFKAIYKTLSSVDEERIVNIQNTTSGILLHLNFPDNPPRSTSFVHHFVAPVGHIISVELYNVLLHSSGCLDNNSLEIYDNYADVNGTRWLLCYDKSKEQTVTPKPPLVIKSYLNSLHIRQKSDSKGVLLNATLKVHLDEYYFEKLIKHKSDVVESCNPNPCQRGGKCVSVGNRRTCQCQKHFTGLFCALTQCDLEPCNFGSCELTEASFKCHCKNGYTGPTCEQKRKPCQDNPCESRGICTERGDAFQCQCHAWWEGTRCEKRIMNIPYKPLSERMLHEPFWLGLMTVTIVMGIIGLVWCAKRHFPEKIEKLLAEEDDRTRSTISSLRSTSVREQLAASASAAVSVNPNPGPGVPRSLFGRLGIRKPSILSLTSPHASGYSPATARTFSLDDLLKPPPRRTPSPKKKRNNSTPTKKNAAEKKQILQQLVSPAANKQNSRKVSLGELIQMSERKLKDQKRGESSEEIKETKLLGKDISAGQLSLVDPKLEKKVTFARLLSKVSQEMSSGSDIELGIMQANKLSCAFARPNSTPPSPGANVRSPNSTSSNQGSDSLTSSDLAIPSALSSSVSDLISNRKPARLPNRQKPASADSILAMFRNFSSSSAGVNMSSSLRVSPSTTPTASSPQDDVVGDDESSTSSIHTPISFSSGPPESPILHRSSQSTIEVPVLDPLSAHKSTSGGSNFLHPPTILLEIPSTISKCLSPIREMPTPLPSPMPSPALTPIMRRSYLPETTDDIDNSDDRISIELPNISLSDEGDEDDMHSIQDIAIDLHAEDGLLQEEVAVMQQGSPSAMFKIKSRPPPLGQTSETLQVPNIEVSESPILPLQLVIPTLTIQTPSPTHKKPSFCGFPGSPPPKSQEDSFQFSNVKPQRKMLKEFDKPTSLDLPCAPPLITITCNLSEADSDTESISPAIKTSSHLNVSSSGMTYLSPFSMVTRSDHNASESNLSSSGYSSMASPGPSRCGSSNPLCPPEMEDPSPPGPGSTNLHPPLRKHIAILKSEANISECGNSANRKEQCKRSRGRSDSETLSDDPLLESNDEGIGTDHIDEKIEDGEVKSAKELEAFINDASKKIKLDFPLITTTANCSTKCSVSEENTERLLPTLAKRTLQLPSIIVQCDTLSLDKCASPVSSRSDSPLSDRTSGVGRFSPQFYSRHKDLLPFTDSDGLYDFPSSDKVNISCSSQQHRKSIGRKREKKPIRVSKTPSPTKGPNYSCTYHLELPKKEVTTKIQVPRKASPKRRMRTQKLMSSSSSSESITSAKEIRLSSSSPSPETIRWVSSVDCFSEKMKSPEASGEETNDDANSIMLPRSDQDLYRHKKISRLRAISHQIRFLRRLEQSLKKKERPVSPADSFNSDEDSPRATSPLLQTKEPKIEIRKSSSSSRLQGNTNYVPSRHRQGKFRKGELLIPEHDRAWKKVVITGNGHSD